MGTKAIKLNPEGGKTESELSPSDVDLGNVLNKAQVAQSDFTQDGAFLVGTGSGTYQEETGNTLRISIGVGSGQHPDFAGIDLTDAAADPAANGEFRRNGTDVKVYTGGAVKNLSDIGSGGSGTGLDYWAVHSTLTIGQYQQMTVHDILELESELDIDSDGQLVMEV